MQGLSPSSNSSKVKKKILLRGRNPCSFGEAPLLMVDWATKQEKEEGRQRREDTYIRNANALITLSNSSSY